MSGSAEPVGLISEPMGNVATEQPGTAIFPSTAFEGQDWFGLSKQVMRGAASGIDTYGEIDPESGRQLTEPEAPIAAADANKAYGIPGKLTFSAPIPASVAQSMRDAKQDEIARADAAARTPPGFWPSAARLGAGFVAGALDPLNIGAMFVPALGEARVAGMLARAGLPGLGTDVLADVAEGGAAAIPSLGSRTAVRGITGAAGGVGFQAPLVALRYGLSKQEQGDYSAMDALGDVMLMGGGMGAAGHVGFGALRDVFGQRFMRSNAGAIVADDPAVAEAATRASVAQMVSGDPVTVDPVVYGLGPEPGGEGAPGEDFTQGASPTIAVPKPPRRLVSFLQQSYTVGEGIHQQTLPGGLRDIGGDVGSIIGGPKGRPGLINNRTGQHLDDATLRAWEAGYFPEHDQRPSINDLLAKIDEDHNGNPVYSMHDQDAVDAYHNALDTNAEVGSLAARTGISFDNKTRDQFFDAVTDHLSQDEMAEEHSRLEPEHAAAYDNFERGMAEHDTPLAQPSRSLEDLEDEYRQENVATAARQRDGGGAEPGSAGSPAGAGEEGGGQVRGASGSPGRAGEEGREETDGSGRVLSESFDQAVRRAGGEPSSEEVATTHMADEATATIRPEVPGVIPAALETQLADIHDALARADKAGLIGDTERAEIEGAKSWIEQAKDYAQGVLQAAACIARGL